MISGSKKNYLNNSTSTFLKQGSIKLTGMMAGLIVSIHIARFHGIDVLGNYALIMSGLSVSSILFSYGINLSAVRYIDITNKTKSLENIRFEATKEYVNLAIKSVLGLNILMIIALYYNLLDINHQTMFLWSIICVLTGYEKILLDIIKVSGSTGQYEVLSSLTKPIAIVTFLYMETKLETSILLSFALNYAIVFIVSGKKTPHAELEKYPDLKSYHGMGGALIQPICNYLILQVIGINFDSSAIGIYNIANKLSSLASISLSLLNIVSASKYNHLIREQRINTLNVELRANNYFALSIAIAVFLSMIAFGQTVIRIFEVGNVGYAYIILIILTFNEVGNVITGPNAMILNLLGRQKVFMKVNLIYLSSVLLSCFVLGFHGNLTVFVIMLIISSISKNLVSLLYLRQKFGVKAAFQL